MVRLIEMKADRFGMMPYFLYDLDCLIVSTVPNFSLCNRAQSKRQGELRFDRSQAGFCRCPMQAGYFDVVWIRLSHGRR